jgi:hypothetical protein
MAAKTGADRDKFLNTKLDSEVLECGKDLSDRMDDSEQRAIPYPLLAPPLVPSEASFAYYHQLCLDARSVATLVARCDVSAFTAACVQLRASRNNGAPRTPTRKRKVVSADTPETPKVRRASQLEEKNEAEDLETIELCVQLGRFLASHATSMLLRPFIPACLERGSNMPASVLGLVVQALVNGATREGFSPAPHPDAYGVFFNLLCAFASKPGVIRDVCSDVCGFLIDERRPEAANVRRDFTTIANAVSELGLDSGVGLNIRRSLSVTVAGSAGALLIRGSDSVAQEVVRAELNSGLASILTHLNVAPGAHSKDSSSGGGSDRSGSIGNGKKRKFVGFKSSSSSSNTAPTSAKGRMGFGALGLVPSGDTTSANDAPRPMTDATSEHALARVRAVVHASPKAMVLLALSCLSPGWGPAWHLEVDSNGSAGAEEDAVSRLLRLLLLLFRSCWLPGLDGTSSPLDDMIK